jgi:uncharacterized protein
MKLRVGLVLTLIALLNLPACQTLNTDSRREAQVISQTPVLPILRGDYFRLDSVVLKRSLHIHVRYPEGYNPGRLTPYPVIYVLDGDSLFPILAANHLFLNLDEGVPDAVVVGIAYGSFEGSINKRGRDYSAPGADATANQGGAPRFQTMLKSELFPRVERQYHVDANRRILFGQSRSAHFVLYSAFTEPDLFWGRIASTAPLQPGRAVFFANPATAMRKDLGLVVTSSERDIGAIRNGALEWFAKWEGRTELPWALKTATLPGATHSADSVNSYRLGMVWLFGREHLLEPPVNRP